MKKAILGAALVMFAFGAVVVAQTTAPAKEDTPKKWSWDGFPADKSVDEQLAWLDANVPNSFADIDTRIDWTLRKAKLMYEFEKISTSKQYLDQLDTDAAKVGVKNTSRLAFEKGLLLTYTFRDYPAAESIAKALQDKTRQKELLRRVYIATNDREKLVNGAEELGILVQTIQAAADLGRKDKLFEFSSTFLKTSRPLFPNHVRTIADILTSITDWSGTTTTKKMVLDLLRDFRKTIPPIGSDAKYNDQWGKLAGDLDLKLQLLEADIAKEAAAK
ncbi:MAG: hypothetical protein FWD61_01220 [Phycisphaerales bacterium]|nr:hypothetical protein [Phycisphaerales bacterium]